MKYYERVSDNINGGKTYYYLRIDGKTATEIRVEKDRLYEVLYEKLTPERYKKYSIEYRFEQAKEISKEKFEKALRRVQEIILAGSVPSEYKKLTTSK